jgi:hypothetical protein
MSIPVGGAMENVQFSIREDDRTIGAGSISTQRWGDTSALIVYSKNGAYAALASGWVRTAPFRGAYFGSRGTVIAPGGTGPFRRRQFQRARQLMPFSSRHDCPPPGSATHPPKPS